MKIKGMHKKIFIFLSLMGMFILVSCGKESIENKISETNSQETSVNSVTSTDIDNAETLSTSSAVTNNADEKSDTTTEDGDIDLIMVGDILLHDKINESGEMADGTYNYDHLFTHVKEDIEAADLALVNQEVILGGRELGLSGYPAFNGAYEVGDALAESGFDVVLHATNHALDKGGKGITNCLSFWENTYPEMAILGINDSQEAQDNQIYVYEQDGINIAILNYTFGTNGIAPPEDMPFAVNYLDEDKIIQDLEKANELADFIIVCPHWGTEYSHEISSEQKKYSKIFVNHGVDLVIGTHPHVTEPVEWVIGDNKEKMLVYYSLGNFINATSGTGPGVADRMVGMMAKVSIGKDDSGNIVILNNEQIPLVSHVVSGVGKMTVYKLEDYSPELALKNEIIVQDSMFSYEYCVECASKY